MDSLIGRLAPSPTGFLHLGNAFSFLLCWLAVKAAGGTLLLRMDDIDSERSRADYARAIIEDLEWLGLDWDAGPGREPSCPWRQSERFEFYREALEKLKDRELAYMCFCSRKDLAGLASAPHLGDAGICYPGFCRDLSPPERARLSKSRGAWAWRLRAPEKAFVFTDLIQGKQVFAANDYGGDFPLGRSNGAISYQLATAVDDALMNVNFVLRGRDLLSSTPRQMAVQEYLGFSTPAYAHIPLLLDASGERLAKRQKSLSLAHLRSRGIKARALVGFLAGLAGLCPAREALPPADLLADFQLSRIPKCDIKIPAEDLAALGI